MCVLNLIMFYVTSFEKMLGTVLRKSKFSLLFQLTAANINRNTTCRRGGLKGRKLGVSWYVNKPHTYQAETETRYIFCETCPIMSDDTCLKSLSTVHHVF